MRLAERLRAALALDLGAGVSLYAGDGLNQTRPDTPGVPAAVLVAITDRPEPGLILTRRPETMRRHPGQVAFPGGRMDPEDPDLAAAALREAEEEIALPRDAVEIVGLADTYRTITGYDVTPVLGVVPPDLPLHPNDEEVAAIFEAPFAFVLDAANHAQQVVMFEGAERRYYEIMWGDHRIWGATAAMLVNLSRRLRWV
jgi:8-oxo-dGTP pyrophosphatase MutT (NUDIX family)